MKKYLLVTLAVTAIMLGGCSTLYNTVVSVTEVRKSVMNEYGELYRKGLSNQKLDAQMEKFDAEFLVAAKATQQSLELYKAGHATEADYLKNLQLVRTIVFNALNVIGPMLDSQKANSLSLQLNKANKL